MYGSSSFYLALAPAYTKETYQTFCMRNFYSKKQRRRIYLKKIALALRSSAKHLRFFFWGGAKHLRNQAPGGSNWTSEWTENRPCQGLSAALQACLYPIGPRCSKRFPRPEMCNGPSRATRWCDEADEWSWVAWRRPSSMVVGLVTDFIWRRVFVVVLTCEQINQKIRNANQI